MSRGLITGFNITFKLTTDGGISYAFRSSNVQRRWKSRAASVPSGDKPKLKGKRVSKDKRREMVVSFVDRYREMNAGKFPTVSIAKTEVGGSFYVVKKILQELEYNSRSSPLDKQNRSTSPKPVIVYNEAVGEVQEGCIDKLRGSTEVENLEINNFGQLQAKGVSEATSTDAENNTSQEVLTSQAVERVDEINKNSEADLGFEKIEESHSSLEMHSDIESISAMKDLSGNDDLKQISTEYEESPGAEKHVRDMKGNQTDNVESPKSRVWEGLKSLADGVVKFWKGM